MGQKITYEIQYTKAADKFFNKHEAVRIQYEESIKELLAGEHPDFFSFIKKRIRCIGI